MIRMPIVWDISKHYRLHRSGIWNNFHDASFWALLLKVLKVLLHEIPIRVIEAGHGGTALALHRESRWILGVHSGKVGSHTLAFPNAC